MKLRTKLVALSLLTLLLPWSGWKLLQELEQFLRETQQAALLASARTVAGAIPMEFTVTAAVLARTVCSAAVTAAGSRRWMATAMTGRMLARPWNFAPKTVNCLVRLLAGDQGAAAVHPVRGQRHEQKPGITD